MSGWRRRIGRARAVLVASAALAAVGWGLAAGLVALELAIAVDALLGLPRGVRSGVLPVAVVAGVVTAAARLWVGRRTWSLAAVALFIESVAPELRFRLVTAVDPAYRDSEDAARLERSGEAVRWDGRVRRSAFTRAVRPLAAAALAAVLLAFAPTGLTRRAIVPAPGDVLARGGAAAAEDPLARVVVTVDPPGYAGGAATVLENPDQVQGLAGSRLTITGRGPADGLTFGTDETSWTAESTRGGWQVRAAMPVVPRLAQLATDGGRRSLLLLPTADSVPEVRLTVPVRDTVLRQPDGLLPLRAVLRDDHGLDRGWFEILVSTGQGESFDVAAYRRGELRVTGGHGELRAAIDLAEVGVAPGAFVHVRAVARDRNDVTGPGVGVSETRTIRVARRGEYDSLAVDVLPPLPSDSSLLSQRLLINVAEALIERRPDVDGEVYAREAQGIGRDQARLRRRVAEILFVRLGDEGEGEHAHGDESDAGPMTPAELLAAAERATDEGMGEALDFHGDETPVVAVNRPLLEAYNAMWDAGRELGVGDPVGALPHMYAALEAIQRARAAERIYLRGRPAAVVVDLADVRLSGSPPDGAPASRVGGAPGVRETLAARLHAVVDRLVAGDPGALDSLLTLRVASLGVAPDAAFALERAAAALRAGEDPTAYLRLAYGRLGGPVAGAGASELWSVIP